MKPGTPLVALIAIIGGLGLSGCKHQKIECNATIAVEQNRSEIRKLGVGDDWKAKNLSVLAPKLEPALLVLHMSPPGDGLDGPEAFLEFRRKDCELVGKAFYLSTS